MSRMPVVLREAVIADAAFLVELWRGSLRRADPREQIADLESVIKAAASSPEQLVLVAHYDGEFAGAVYACITTLSPINLDPAVHALYPRVVPHLRRRGVGRALMDAVVSFAEESGIGHIGAAALAGSRDGNRFLAQLAMGSQATWRVGATSTIRAKLSAQFAAQLPASQRSLGRGPQRVLAARRLRRAQTRG